MVYPRQQISRMEEGWLPFMGLWQSCASATLPTLMATNSLLEFVAGAGKSILWYVNSRLFLG